MRVHSVFIIRSFLSYLLGAFSGPGIVLHPGTGAGVKEMKSLFLMTRRNCYADTDKTSRRHRVGHLMKVMVLLM